MKKIITISFDEEEIKAIMYWFMIYQKKKNAKGHTIAKIDTNTATKIAAKVNKTSTFNGWDYWHYQDSKKRLISINEIRKKIRN